MAADDGDDTTDIAEEVQTEGVQEAAKSDSSQRSRSVADRLDDGWGDEGVPDLDREARTLPDEYYEDAKGSGDAASEVREPAAAASADRLDDGWGDEGVPDLDREDSPATTPNVQDTIESKLVTATEVQDPRRTQSAHDQNDSPDNPDRRLESGTGERTRPDGLDHSELQSSERLYRSVSYSSAEVNQQEKIVDEQIAAGDVAEEQRQSEVDRRLDELCERRALEKPYFTPEPALTPGDVLQDSAVAPEWSSTRLKDPSLQGTIDVVPSASGDFHMRQYEVIPPVGTDLYVGAAAPQGYTDDGLARLRHRPGERTHDERGDVMTGPPPPIACALSTSLRRRGLHVLAPHEPTAGGWTATEVGFPNQPEQRLVDEGTQLKATDGLDREAQRKKHQHGLSLYEVDHNLTDDVLNTFSGDVSWRRA